jgi:hypothetical protein
MTEYAPAAIQNVYNRITIGSKQMSGIIGDSAHTYGYHRCRDVLPSNDYSRQLALDKQGDGQAASALDVSFNSGDMKLVTQRLLDAAKAGDSRLSGLREFGGTTNGSVTKSYDLSNGHEGNGEWDSSHLWHVHLSFYRAYANDTNRLATIADVINAGGGSAPPVPMPAPGVWSLPPGHWYGIVTGPNEQHSGAYEYDDDVVRNGVTQIQNKINDLGFNAGYVDGLYEQQTVDGVVRWQAATGRPQTGLIHPDDWSALFGGGGSTPAPQPPGGGQLRRPWPSYMPTSEYFGLITGPNESHGGFNANEQPDVKAIQDRINELGYDAGFADGLFEQPTADGVSRWQRDRYAATTSRYGEIWNDDWQHLFTW